MPGGKNNGNNNGNREILKGIIGKIMTVTTR
jgi:hypothetical protein